MKDEAGQSAAKLAAFITHPSSLHHRPPLPLEVREVRSRRDLDRFVKLPWRIYAEDPHWVPPLLLEVKEFLNRRKHPFYKHGDATQFIALRGGEAVGRILVSDDPRYNQQRGEQRRLLRHVRVRRRPGGGPRPARRRRRLARGARPHEHHAARSTIRSTTPAACWSKVSTRRRGS